MKNRKPHPGDSFAVVMLKILGCLEMVAFLWLIITFGSAHESVRLIALALVSAITLFTVAHVVDKLDRICYWLEPMRTKEEMEEE